METWDKIARKNLDEIAQLLEWQIIKKIKPVEDDIPMGQVVETHTVMPNMENPITQAVQAALATVQLLGVEIDAIAYRMGEAER